MTKSSAQARSAPIRAAVYARHTDEEQRADQVSECRRVCEAKGWMVVGVYADRGSANSAWRPELQRLEADSELGAYDVVVVASIDRLSRNFSQLDSLIERFALRRHKIVAVDLGADGQDIADLRFAPLRVRKFLR